MQQTAAVRVRSPFSEMTGPDPISPVPEPMCSSLRTLGYVEGKNIVLERRSSEGKFCVEQGDRLDGAPQGKRPAGED